MGIGEKIVSIAIAGVALAGVGVVSYFVSDTVDTRIIDTQVKRYNNSDKYLIYTDSGVFENTDAWYRFKFRSSDLQSQAMKLKGKKARIEKYGWRNGFFSLYENVVEIKPLE